MNRFPPNEHPNMPMPVTKPAICCKCGKKSPFKVPMDAEDVTCFKCSEEAARKR